MPDRTTSAQCRVIALTSGGILRMLSREYTAAPDATKPTYLMALHETNTGRPPIQECGNAIETAIEAGCPA